MGWSTWKMNNTWRNNQLWLGDVSPSVWEEIICSHNSINESLTYLSDVLENNPSWISYVQLSTILDWLLNYTSNIDWKVLMGNDILALHEDFWVNENLHYCFDLMTKLSVDNLWSNVWSKTYTGSNNVFLNYYYSSIWKIHTNNKIFMNILQEYVKQAKLHDFGQRAKNIWKNNSWDTMKKLALDFITYCETYKDVSIDEIQLFLKTLDSTGISILKSTLVLERKQNTAYWKIISKS